MIELNGVCKTFRVAKRGAGLSQAVKSFIKPDYTYVEALKDISFTIEPGEIVGYIGPNGAGKSTTIKIMCGILTPDSGRLNVIGFEPAKERLKYVSHIGVVFGQRSQLWWDVPAIDSFEYLKDLYRIPQPEYKNNLDLLSDELELGELTMMPVRQLSLGQRMRCEIAASLLHGPSVLFLDEPTIGLDAVSKIKVRRFIKRINAEKRVTVILTTHDMQDIEALTDRIILIGRGRILYDGEMAGIKERFSDRAVMAVEFTASSAPLNISAGEINFLSETRAEISLNEGVKPAAVISEIASQRDLRDFNVRNTPIEEVIANLYKEMQI